MTTFAANLPQELYQQAEAEALALGISLDEWLEREVRRAVMQSQNFRRVMADCLAA